MGYFINIIFFFIIVKFDIDLYKLVVEDFEKYDVVIFILDDKEGIG